jgi:uncharacterized membrane protein YgdD (TMEM256/DUF423 family)
MDSDNTLPHKSILLYAILLMTTGIALGAIGAHALENVKELTPKNIESWKTGVLYQLLMSGGLILMMVMERLFHLSSLKTSLIILSIGVSLFAFSIYILVLNHIWNIDMVKYMMIPLTPIGGVLMIVAWALLFMKVIKR